MRNRSPAEIIRHEFDAFMVRHKRAMRALAERLPVARRAYEDLMREWNVPRAQQPPGQVDTDASSRFRAIEMYYRRAVEDIQDHGDNQISAAPARD